MKDLLLAPKTWPNDTNYGGGNLDLIVQEGHLLEVEEDDMVPQAVLKGTISPVNPVNGYGVAVSELRGTKEVVPLRMTIITRLLRTVSLIAKWYSADIKLKKFNIWTDPVESSFNFQFEVNERFISMAV